MITSNGSHVIVHKSRHGTSVFRCTIENAKRLLNSCLENEALPLMQLREKLMLDGVAVRSVDVLSMALLEVRSRDSEALMLNTLTYGPKPKEGEDNRPQMVVTPEMESELVLACYKLKLDPYSLDKNLTACQDIEKLIELWNTLSFFKQARERMGPQVRFLAYHDIEGLRELRVLLADKWKESAREEKVVANYFCTFLSAWGTGTWSVERVLDAD